ncbi:hypothetical protein [Hymenobacter latericus]|uniref:hypothetical protein n=1 Tax=Hymenobacter sp. YIM 151858-1 TaxID=2987688 RepID=UPI0022276188|nr:hypothetical protein [Hymenobacter sp. YIM 151858-1]UYZ60089.1 hypothetical protein OIS50_04635 [Hymenobacter sp. YIM 151858-1]
MEQPTTHIVCFSGGHSSGIVAIEVVRRYGKENVLLLNHNINRNYEDADIKRFKQQVADYLGLPITYANIDGIEDDALIPDQFDISLRKKGFKAPGTGDAFCTYELKTKPFMQFLELNFPDKNVVIYYGFDDDEQHRIARREMILGNKGYKTDFPIARWPSTIEETSEIGIPRPMTYATYKHGNCAGCEKGGIQHWYVTYCHRYDVFTKAKNTEASLGYTILKDQRGGVTKPLPLTDLEPVFARMKCAGVPNTEHYDEGKFKKYLKQYRLPELSLFAPCECSF